MQTAQFCSTNWQQINTMDSNIAISMDNGEAKVTSGLQDADGHTSRRSFTEATIPVTTTIGQTFVSSQSCAVVLGEENKAQPNEMVFAVVAVDNNINELIQSTLNDVGLSKGVQLSLVPRVTESITSTINTDDIQLTSGQTCAPFNQLALIASTMQQTSQEVESQQFLTQKKDGEKPPSFHVASLETLDEDSKSNKSDDKIDDSPEKKHRVTCSVCDQDFSDLPSMRRHRLIHSNDKPFQCEFCDKAFRRKDNLREHRNIHTLENVYSCTRCGKTFPRKYTHKVHMARFCTKEKPSSDSRKDEDAWGQLDTGTKTNRSNSGTKSSSTKTSVSNNKSSDPCHICLKTFRDSSTLKRHLLTHSDDRPFKCDQCKKSFRRKDHLQEHVIVHNEVRPYPCPQCGKSFSRKNGLKTHMIRTSHGPGFKVSPSKGVMVQSLIDRSQDANDDKLIEAQGSGSGYQNILVSNQVFQRNSDTNKDLNVDMKINEDVNISMDLDFSQIKINLNSQNPGGNSDTNPGSALIIDGLKQTETTVVLSDKNGETPNVSRNNAFDFREFGAASTSSNFIKCSKNVCSTAISDSKNEKVSVVQENPTGKNNDGILQCSNCQDVFHGKEQLWRHFQDHLTENMVACEHCLATFTETGQFQAHQKKCHEVINTDTQPQNDYSRKHGETIPKHTASQSEDVMISADNLEDRSEIDGGVQGSSNDETAGEDVTIKGLRMCTVCKKQFRDATALRRHLLVHSGERPHACEQCSKRFRRRDHLKSHVTAYHCGTATFNCKNCEMVFNNRYSLSIHHKSCKDGMLSETMAANMGKIPDITESKSCPICQKTFKDSSTQKRHIRIHSEERPFHCDICPKSFRRKDNLKEHMLCHSDLKPFACSDCGKALSRRSSLTNHQSICPMSLRRIDATASALENSTMAEMNFVRAHPMTKDPEVNNDTQDDDEPMEEDTQDDGDDDGDQSDFKGFCCNQCGKVFRAKWTLKYHERVHTGEKPYTCLTCDRQFRQPGHLKIHERTHSGERPYVCEACGRAFIDSSTLRRHTRVHKDTASDPEEIIHDSVDSEGTAVHHSEGMNVDGDCIQIADSSSDGTTPSSQPISTNIVSGINQSEGSLVHMERAPESHVGEMAVSSKFETLSEINWQQNPQENLENQIAYLSPTTKPTNKDACTNTSENITFP